MKPQFHQADFHLCISFAALFLPLVLYLFRYMDDNRLTSWSWVFTAAEPGVLFAILIVIVVVLHLLVQHLPSGHSPLFLALISFMVSSLFWSTPEVIVDASRYFVQAKQFNAYGFEYYFKEWGREIFAWTDLPLMPFIYGLVFKVFGECRLVIQVLNAAIFSMTTLLVYSLGKHLWDKETGFHAGLLLLGFPFLFSQIPLMLVDIGATFFLLLAVVAMYRAVAGGGPVTVLFAALAIFLAVLVKYSTWLLLMTLMPIICCVEGRQLRTCLRLASVVAMLSIAGICMVIWFYHEVMYEQLLLLVNYQKPGLQRWGESLISTFFFQTHPLLTIAAVLSVFHAWRKRDWRWLVIALPIIFLLVFLEIRRSRYTIPVFPLIALLAAYGIGNVADPVVRRHLVAVIVLSSIILAKGAFLPFLKSMDESNLRDAGAYLDTRQADEVLVILDTTADMPVLDQRVKVPLLDLFTKKTLRYMETSGPLPDPARVAISPLRFTWEFSMPNLYLDQETDQWPKVMVVISDREQVSVSIGDDKHFPDADHITRFACSSGVFQNRTVVDVYEYQRKP